jgi:hypothetical protein
MDTNSSNRKKSSVIFKVVGGLIACIAFGAMIIPSLASTSWGNHLLKGAINSNIDGQVEFKKLDVSWFGKQSIEDLELKDTNGKQILTIENVNANNSLISLIMSQGSKGSYEIKNLNAHLIQYADGSSNLTDTLSKVATKTAETKNHPISVELSDVNLAAMLSDADLNHSLKLTGKTRQDSQEGSFDINVSFGDLNQKDLMDGLNAKELEKIHIQAKADNFPVRLIDEIVGLSKPDLRGLTLAAIGDKISASIKQENQTNAINLKLDVQAPLFQGTLNGNIKDNVLIIQNPSVFRWTIDPKFINEIRKVIPNAPIELTRPSEASLDLADTSIYLDLDQKKKALIDLNQSKLMSQLSINLSDFVIDGQSQLLSQALGQKLVAKVELDYRKNPQALVELASDKIKMNPMAFNMGSTIKLASPVEIQIPLSSQLINQFALKDQSVQIGDSSPLKINIRNLEFPAKETSDISQWKLALQSTLDQIHFVDSAGNHTFSLQGFDLIADGYSLSQLNLDAKGKVIPANNPLYQNLIGNEANFKLLTTVAIDKKTVDINDVNVKVTSPTLAADFKGKIENFHKIKLSSPAQIHYTLQPSTLYHLGYNDLKLDSPSHIDIVINADKQPIDISNPSLWFLKGQMNVDQINLANNAGSILQLSLPWEINALANQISLDMNAHTRLNGVREEGYLNGLLKIKNWVRQNKIDLETTTLESQISLNQFPVAFIEKLSEEKALTDILGHAINVNIHSNVALAEKKSGQFSISFNNSEIQGQGAYEFTPDGALAITNQPTNIRLTLTPAKWNALRGKLDSSATSSNAIVLTSPSALNFNIHEMKLPLNPASFLKANIKSDFSIDRLNIQDKQSGDQVVVSNVKGNIDSPQIDKVVAINLTGQQSQSNSTPLPFNMNMQIQNGFNAKGDLDMDHLTLSLDSQFQKFPIKLLGQFLSLGSDLSNKLSAMFGQVVDANIQLRVSQMQGPVTANVSGANGSFSLDAKINNGILTLNKNFQTQVKITPELGYVVLKDVFPLASGIIGSENPLTLNIDANGFSAPIKDFSMANLTIGSAYLDLGKVFFKNEGQLASILSLFNTTQTSNLSVWFTPLYVSMQNGRVNFNRMDMLLLNTYPIAAWGTVDIPSDRVNMIIGLTGQALKKGFGIQGVGKNAMLQLPLTGTLSNARIDKSKATAKIAAMVASNHGIEGQLIGTALQIASGGLEEKAPAPTTNPLPWATDDDSSGQVSNTPSSDKKKSKKDKKNPMNQIDEKASDLIRNLLPF